MEKHLIKTKLIERKTVKGILMFLADSLYVVDTSDSEKHKTETLCYLGFFNKIEDDIRNCNNIEQVIKNHLAAWRSDSDNLIQELKKNESRAHVEYMVTSVEKFMIETILERYD